MSFSKPFSVPKSFSVWPYLMALSLLCGCDQAGKTAVEKKIVKKSKSDTVISLPATKPTVTDTTQQSDCPRAASESVVKTNVFPNAHFNLQADRMTGIETFTLPEGDKVKIIQSGCEYYTLKFQIETARFAADTTDITYWENASVILMKEVNKGLHTPLEISKGLEKLSAQKNADKPLQLGDEIDFGGPDPREYLSIDRIGQLAGQRYLIEITFSYGPM
ncbi:hypothetical protein [Mucilaginibacter sp.]|uniref:hypothetical protein n=1 Tax=Mucilaginibacter sp. TaxID=1882438 RepID=UPI0035BC0B7C